MKAIIMVLGLSLVLMSASFAGECRRECKPGPQGAVGAPGIEGQVGQDGDRYNEYGAKLDAPNIVRLNKSWTVGAEASKNFNHMSSNEGYAVYGKVTWTGSLFDFSKK